MKLFDVERCDVFFPVKCKWVPSKAVDLPTVNQCYLSLLKKLLIVLKDRVCFNPFKDQEQNFEYTKISKHGFLQNSNNCPIYI